MTLKALVYIYFSISFVLLIIAYSRQVIKNYNNIESYSSKTLKDLDFNILEGQIFIDPAK